LWWLCPSAFRQPTQFAEPAFTPPHPLTYPPCACLSRPPARPSLSQVCPFLRGSAERSGELAARRANAAAEAVSIHAPVALVLKASDLREHGARAAKRTQVVYYLLSKVYLHKHCSICCSFWSSATTYAFAQVVRCTIFHAARSDPLKRRHPQQRPRMRRTHLPSSSLSPPQWNATRRASSPRCCAGRTCATRSLWRLAGRGARGLARPRLRPAAPWRLSGSPSRYVAVVERRRRER